LGTSGTEENTFDCLGFKFGGMMEMDKSGASEDPKGKGILEVG